MLDTLARFRNSIARFAGSILVVGFDPGAYAPGFMLSPAPQADPDSNESLVVIDAILLQELNELVAKGDLQVMLLLSSNVLPHCFNIRLTYRERTITTLPRKVL